MFVFDTGAHSVAQDRLKFIIFLSQHLESSNYSPGPLHPAMTVFSAKKNFIFGKEECKTNKQNNAGHAPLVLATKETEMKESLEPKSSRSA